MAVIRTVGQEHDRRLKRWLIIGERRLGLGGHDRLVGGVLKAGGQRLVVQGKDRWRLPWRRYGRLGYRQRT